MFYGASPSLRGWSRLVLRQRQALRERHVDLALAQCHAYQILLARISHRPEHIHKVGKWTPPLDGGAAVTLPRVWTQQDKSAQDVCAKLSTSTQHTAPRLGAGTQ